MREDRNLLRGREATATRRVCLRVAPVALLSAFLLSAGPSSAAASPPVAPGVHIDPGSPVAKEYAIPLTQARGGAGGGGQLFGAGITRAPGPPAAGTPAPAPTVTATASTNTPTGARTQHRSANTAGAPTSQVKAKPRSVAPGAPLSGAGRASAGAAGITWMLGAAALVLALGGLGGAALARYSRSASTRTS